jgi:hypothetical protein
MQCIGSSCLPQLVFQHQTFVALTPKVRIQVSHTYAMRCTWYHCLEAWNETLGTKQTKDKKIKNRVNSNHDTSENV